MPSTQIHPHSVINVCPRAITPTAARVTASEQTGRLIRHRDCARLGIAIVVVIGHLAVIFLVMYTPLVCV